MLKCVRIYVFGLKMSLNVTENTLKDFFILGGICALSFFLYADIRQANVASSYTCATLITGPITAYDQWYTDIIL